MLDRASERLGMVRRQRRDNMQSLRQGMNEWARNLASQNVSEEALVVIRRDRLCVPVKAGRQVSYLASQTTRCMSSVYCSHSPHISILCSVLQSWNLEFDLVCSECCMHPA